MDVGRIREETLFEAARQLIDPAERKAFLDLACPADLRERIEEMIAGLEQADRFFQEGEAALKSPLPAGIVPLEKSGDTIGRYKLLERIGEGGYGIVYMAEQQQPVRRRVALKVIKLGMDTRSVVARFEAERQALALMEHPNIARVLDAGATDTGRPFFVMELVRGIRITDYCDQNQVTTGGRLELFSQVCQAVQHAHQKGIIHRDLKPSNILVTENDGVAVPKVIDFGIAKATVQQLTDKTLFTAFAQFLGTPAYMSPEQASLTSLDIDTRADIYSLGVLLYELLTGHTPFDTRLLLKNRGWEAMRRTICEDEPLRPSTRLGSMTMEHLTTRAQRHQTEPTRLLHQIRGDLDWIVMKCLEKDRTRRYATANALAMDLQRHLRNEPVMARPPSRIYEFRKNVRRHYVGFTATAAIMIILAAGVIVSTIQAIRADRLRISALRAEVKASSLERDARLEADHARSAEADAREKLRASYLAQAQAGRWSRREGRRFIGLDLLKEAAKMRRGLDLRNEAIVCMALADIRLVQEWQVPSTSALMCDAAYERYACNDLEGNLYIRRVEDSAELHRLTGYEMPFRDYGFSPDGRWFFLAYGKQGDRAEIVDLEHHSVLIHLTQPLYRCMGFSADSRFAAIAYESPQLNWPIQIFDLSSGKQVAGFEHRSLPFSLRFHPTDPQKFLTSDASPMVRLWDWSSGQVVQRFEHPKNVQGIAWHPDGNLFAAGCADDRVHIWDQGTGKQRLELVGHDWFPVDVSFSRDGEFLISRGWEGVAFLWDPYSGRELLRKPVFGFTFPFGTSKNRFGAKTSERTYGVFEASRGLGYRLLRGDPAADGRGVSCDFSGTDDVLISSNENGIRLWDLRSSKCVDAVLDPGTWPYVAFEADGTNIFVSKRASLERWRIDSGAAKLTRVEELENSAGGGPVQLCADGSTIAHWIGPGFRLVDVVSGRERNRLLTPGTSVHGTMSPDGRLAATYTTYAPTNEVRIWDVTESRVIKSLAAGPSICGAFSPDGKRFTIGDSEQFRTWDLDTWRVEYSIRRELSGHYAYLAFSPDSRVLAVAISRNAIRLVEAATGSELATLEGPDSMDIEWITFNKDGSRLAVVNGHSTIQLWELGAVREQLASMNLDWDLPPYHFEAPRK